MQSIWKQVLEATNEQTVQLPKGAKILCVQAQRETPCIWFRTRDTKSKETESRTFAIYGTDHEHHAITGEYIGTFQLQGGALVFHVFEK